MTKTSQNHQLCVECCCNANTDKMCQKALNRSKISLSYFKPLVTFKTSASACVFLSKDSLACESSFVFDQSTRSLQNVSILSVKSVPALTVVTPWYSGGRDKASSVFSTHSCRGSPCDMVTDKSHKYNCMTHYQKSQ